MPDLVGVSPMQNKEPKRYKVPSNDYGITASDAADTLIRAEEIKGNKELHNAASKYISGKLREAKLQAAKNASKANAS